VKPGIVVITTIAGPVGQRIHELQQRFDPRMATELPPHITLVGSSGMGPIAPDTPTDVLHEALAPIAATTAPIPIRFGAAMRFMQTEIVVLPLDPHGPLRALHERIRMSGLPYESPRFAFTPHLTLSFYPELSRERRRELLAVRVPEPVIIDRIQVYRTVTITRTELEFELELGGAVGP
jgi:2'-5' RNA ligase